VTLQTMPPAGHETTRDAPSVTDPSGATRTTVGPLAAIRLTPGFRTSLIASA
jgi:hypothetical protein